VAAANVRRMNLCNFDEGEIPMAAVAVDISTSPGPCDSSATTSPMVVRPGKVMMRDDAESLMPANSVQPA